MKDKFRIRRVRVHDRTIHTLEYLASHKWLGFIPIKFWCYECVINHCPEFICTKCFLKSHDGAHSGHPINIYLNRKTRGKLDFQEIMTEWLKPETEFLYFDMESSDED